MAHLGTADSSVKFSGSGYHEMGRDLTSRAVKPVGEFYQLLEVISLDEYRQNLCKKERVFQFSVLKLVASS